MDKYRNAMLDVCREHLTSCAEFDQFHNRASCSPARTSNDKFSQNCSACNIAHESQPSLTEALVDDRMCLASDARPLTWDHCHEQDD